MLLGSKRCGLCVISAYVGIRQTWPYRHHNVRWRLRKASGSGIFRRRRRRHCCRWWLLVMFGYNVGQFRQSITQIAAATSAMAAVRENRIKTTWHQSRRGHLLVDWAERRYPCWVGEELVRVVVQESIENTLTFSRPKTKVKLELATDNNYTHIPESTISVNWN